MTTLLARKVYVALTITITASTVQNLLVLVNAALAASGKECPGAAREVNLQNANGNTASIFVGDSDVSNTNAGYELAAGSSAVGASRTYRSGEINGVDVGRLFVFSTGTDQKLNVEVCAY